MHAEYGGVVPELASRDHVRKLLPLIQEALAEAGTRPRPRSTGSPIRPARAGGGPAGGRCRGPQPGLCLGSARCRRPPPGRPSAGADARSRAPPKFPFLALLVSGGHTLLAEVRGLGRLPDHRRFRSTTPPARPSTRPPSCSALPYPGGPALATARASTGAPGRFRFPRPMLDRPGLDFSFSGLKTAVVVATRGAELDEQIARRCRRRISAGRRRYAGREVRARARRRRDSTLVVAGGVGANRASAPAN